jgi:hypothetical protein
MELTAHRETYALYKNYMYILWVVCHIRTYVQVEQIPYLCQEMSLVAFQVASVLTYHTTQHGIPQDLVAAIEISNFTVSAHLP